MKLSDIKGERSLDIIADIMELIDKMSEDDRFTKLADAIKQTDGEENSAWKALCRYAPPLLREQSYRDNIISILANIGDVSIDEYRANGDILADVFELISSDDVTLDFFTSAPPKKD